MRGLCTAVAWLLQSAHVLSTTPTAGDAGGKTGTGGNGGKGGGAPGGMGGTPAPAIPRKPPRRAASPPPPATPAGGLPPRPAPRPRPLPFAFALGFALAFGGILGGHRSRTRTVTHSSPSFEGGRAKADQEPRVLEAPLKKPTDEAPSLHAVIARRANFDGPPSPGHALGVRQALKEIGGLQTERTCAAGLL